MDRAAEAQRDLLARMPVAVAVCDDAQRIVRLSAAFTDLLGYTLADIPTVAAWWERAVPDPDARGGARARWEAGLAALAAGAVPRACEEYRVRDRQGAVRAVEIALTLVGGDIVAFFTDQTALRDVEEVLQDHRDWVCALVRATPSPLFAKDREGRYTLVNRAWEAFTGRTAAEVVGRTVDECWSSEDADTYHRKDLELMSSDGVQSYEYRMTNATGELRDVVFQKACYHAADGSVAGLLGTFWDVTERKRSDREARQAEARLLHAQKMESLGLLAGGIAHDFNNLLVAILGHADLALAVLPPDLPGVDHVREVRRAAVRASELSSQMLAYSGRGRFVVQAVDLNDVVTELGQLLSAAVSKKTALRYRLAPDLPPVEADVVQLRQLVMNLVTNASEALRGDPGRVTIGTEPVHLTGDYLATSYGGEGLPAGRYVGLEVSDTGCGMDEATIARLFEPFFSSKGRGRGLGLAAIQGIVRGHHGAIRVYSELGRGTSFKVLLPASSRAVEPVPAEPATDLAGWRGSGTILVVDDEPSVREIARLMLERSGFAVVTAEDGEQAIARFRERPDEIRAVFLDLTMPRMSGEQALAELLRIRAEVKIVLASGYNEQDVTERFETRGTAGFIPQPFDLQTLVGTFRRVLGD